MNDIVKLQDIGKKYFTRAGELPVLSEVNLSIAPGDFIAIVGHSGAGKSTLLHIIGLLDRPTSGEIYFGGEKVQKMSQARLDVLRNRGFGFVFQFYHLLPEFDALENTMMPQMIRHNFFSWLARSSKIRKRCTDVLEMFGLGKRLHHKPGELSGGEQQRVAIARALAGAPSVLLADEPTGNLDEKTGKDIFDILIRLNKEKGQALVVVTHDVEIALKAHRTLVLRDGSLHPFDDRHVRIDK